MLHEEQYWLPEHYGEDRVTLMMVDPENLYAYWEMTGKPAGTPFVRLFEIRERYGKEVPDLRLQTEVAQRGNYYFHNISAGSKYFAEAGWMTDAGFVIVARSNVLSTPRLEPTAAVRRPGAVTAAHHFPLPSSPAEHVWTGR